MKKNNIIPIIALTAFAVLLIALLGLRFTGLGEAFVRAETPEPTVAISASPEPTATPSPTPEPTPTPTPEPTPRNFVISMVGDCTLSSSQRNNHFEDILKGDMKHPFSGTLEYFKDDYLSIGNLECSFSDRKLYGSTLFQFLGPAKHAEILSEGSIEFMTLANNHTMDFGQDGLDDSKAALDAVGVMWAGPNESAIYQREDGLKIGLYAARWIAGQKEVTDGVAALKARGDLDLIICLMHWGIEGSYRVLQVQEQMGRAAIDAGADIIYGSHPHVLHRVEEYNNGLIIYSLGNWSFGGNTAPRDRDTAIVQVTVTKNPDGTVLVSGWNAIPCSLSSTPGINDYRPIPYEKDSEEYNRAMSKLLGTFKGPDLNVDYSAIKQGDAGGSSGGGGEEAPTPPEGGGGTGGSEGGGEG